MEGENVEERERDIQKSSAIDQSEYPTNKSTYPVIQSQHTLRAISTGLQYSVRQRAVSISLSFPFLVFLVLSEKGE